MHSRTLLAETISNPAIPKSKKNLISKDTRALHRVIGTILMLFTLYFGATGSMIQMVDIKAVLSHAAATDPEMLAIRESIDGTPNYSVIQATDYAAPALPGNFDFNMALANVLKTARSSTGDNANLKYVELRVVEGKPIGIVQASDGKANRMLRIDPASGTLLPNPAPRPRTRPAPSMHNVFKRWHRLQQFNLGDQWEWINGAIGIGLFLMIITGIVLYFRLLRARSRAGLKSFFWSAGGLWRSVHRSVSVVAAAFLLVVSISGTLLSIDSVGLGLYMNAHQDPSKPGRQFPAGMVGDLSSPLADAELPAMLQTTLSSFRADKADAPIKVLRLRYYSGQPQGLLIYGGGEDTGQIVYNTSTGRQTSTTEPGYPYTGFPLGWKWHELVKQIHRGDILGIPGRFMDLFAAFSLVFLSASGLVMYLDVWRKRRRTGKISPFWI
jgi:uncharacterized iron-regulated membrane protein